MDIKQCPACGYKRRHSDGAPKWQCPHCERAYAKIAASSPPPAHNPKPRGIRRASLVRIAWICFAFVIGFITFGLAAAFVVELFSAPGWHLVPLAAIIGGGAYAAYLIWPDRVRILLPRSRDKYCTNCRSVGRPKMVVPGSLASELIVWLFMLILAPFTLGISLLVAFVYSLSRQLASRRQACRQCGAVAMIPLNSPRANQELNAD